MTKDRIYIDAQHGLGNRLRAIASAAAIATGSKRELVIVWEPDHHCDCRWGDLFEYSGPVIEKSFHHVLDGRTRLYSYMEIEPNAEKDSEIILSPGENVYVRSAYVLNNPFTKWDLENKFLRELRPAEAVMDLVRPFDLSKHIGAHIRMEAGRGLDHNTYDSAENWTSEGHELIHKWRESSHYNNFIKRIDEHFAKNSDARLFLAADMAETYRVFQKHYGERMSFLRRDVYDRSKLQIIYGLADAILLSQCQKLLGSTWSSFTELAIRMSLNYSAIEMSGTDF